MTTIEEKAKRYDEALAYARNVYRLSSNPAEIQRMVEIFPELAMSEDEKVRKALIRFHKSTINIDGIKGDEIISWLKKQVGQKPAWSEEDEIARKALINLVEIYYGGCIDKTEKKRLLNLLKSLRPQKQWKPSDEQMNTLNLVVSDYYHACTKECDEKAIVLKSILEQLKQRIGG